MFDDVAQAIDFDEEGIRKVVSNISELLDELPTAVQKCLEYFGVDRSVSGYEGLIAAQDCLPNNEVRDRFARDCSFLARLWEAISPDPILSEFETDYVWITKVYESVKPTSRERTADLASPGRGTIELIQQDVSVDAVHDDLDTLV